MHLGAEMDPVKAPKTLWITAVLVVNPSNWVVDARLPQQHKHLGRVLAPFSTPHPALYPAPLHPTPPHPSFSLHRPFRFL